MPSLEDLFCCVDDFCQQFEPQWRNQLREWRVDSPQAASKHVFEWNHDDRELPSTNLLTAISRHTTIKPFGDTGRGNFLVWWAILDLWSGCPMPYCPYVPTCPSSLASARALAFLTLPALRFVITVVFINTKSLKSMPSGAKPQGNWFYGFKLHLVVNERALVAQFHLDTREHRWPSTRAAIAATINR